MTGQNQLQINAPQDMYTMSDQRVSHVIQPHEWVLIKRCEGSELREWAIGLCGASFGFTQNVYNVGQWVYSGKPPLTAWDVIAALFFTLLASAGVALFVVAWGKKGEFAALIAEIDKRRPLPFNSGDVPRGTAATGPLVRGRSIDSILTDAMSGSRSPSNTESGRQP
jgi:hypothetical protein